VTSTTQFPTLLSPLDHGRLHLKNRVVFPAHQTLLSSGGVVGERMLGYYLERARNGVAAVIVEGGAVHPTTLKFPEYLRFYDPASIAPLDRLADALHEHECKVVVQLAHSGSRMNTSDSRLPLWAPSDVRSANTHEIPHQMTRAEIVELIESYAQTAGIVGRTRVDGVEIHAAHEYLLSEFFSPLNNHRNDEYGGSLENRVRLASEVILRVREVLGDDKVIGLRLNGSDLVPGGLEVDDCAQIAHLLDATGALDYINVSAGRSSHNQAIVPPMDAPRVLYADLAERIKHSVSVPVIAVGRIKTPAEAESVLASGKADVVAIARSLIADPAWVAKAAASEPIRPCISCNQGCYGYMVTIRPISCTVNPSVGLEYLGRAPAGVDEGQALDAVVIGGGPAGMEAAIGLARAGHRVTLLEASSRLGGQVRLASMIAARAEMSDIIDHQALELDRLGVQVRLAQSADVD
jgi:2,4-dienoyl-CoA reductase (NADPH2)